jgi:polysaccharide pyruvyl transferase CsaB
VRQIRDFKVLIDRIPYAEGNVGEEAILTSLLQDLRAIGITNISILSNMPERTALRHGKNVRVVRDSPSNWLKLPIEVMRSDLLIWGGGHMLQDRSSQLYIPYVTKTLILAKLLAKPRFIYAPGLGPVVNRLGRLFSAKAISNAETILVRDQGSFDFLQSLDIKQDVTLTADPAYSLTTSSDEYQPPLAGKQPLIAYAPRKHFYRKGSMLPVSMQKGSRDGYNPQFERYLQEVAAALDRAVEVLKVQVVFLPMDLGPNPRDDLVCHHLRLLMVHRESTRIMDGDPPLTEFIRRLGELDLLISDRLHGIILGMRFGLPFIGIDSDGKIGQMAKGIGHDSAVIHDQALERDLLFEMIERSLNYRDSIRSDLREKGRTLRQRSQENRTYLAQCIASRLK